MTSKVQNPAAKKPPNAGKGRVAGVPNKITKQLKDMILGALAQVGGQDYLAKQAIENPVAFLALVGKVLPLTLSGTDGGAIQVQLIERRIVRPESADTPTLHAERAR